MPLQTLDVLLTLPLLSRYQEDVPEHEPAPQKHKHHPLDDLLEQKQIKAATTIQVRFDNELYSIFADTLVFHDGLCQPMDLRIIEMTTALQQ